jgi:hypothetical protein
LFYELEVVILTFSRGLPNVRLFPLLRTNPNYSYRNDYGQPEKVIRTWIQDSRQYVAAHFIEGSEEASKAAVMINTRFNTLKGTDIINDSR